MKTEMNEMEDRLKILDHPDRQTEEAKELTAQIQARVQDITVLKQEIEKQKERMEIQNTQMTEFRKNEMKFAEELENQRTEMEKA